MLAIDVDREKEQDLIDIARNEGVVDDASHGFSEQSEPEEEEDADEALPGANDPSSDASETRASTPYRQTPESSDSEDESVCSASDDGGAARMERLFGAAHLENRTMPPSLPPASRDPRIAAAAGLANRAEVPKNLPDRNRSSLAPAINNSLPSPVLRFWLLVALPKGTRNRLRKGSPRHLTLCRTGSPSSTFQKS